MVFRKTKDRALRPGDVVEVRTPAEILATLESNASLDNMPFMPEMLRYSGRRFTVSSRAEKICDTVSGGLPRSRKMQNTVLLEDLRCDGSGHGGCQAGCRLYWKEAWLRRVDPNAKHEGRSGDRRGELDQLARDGTRTVRAVDGAATESYRCQATEALRATAPVGNYDLRQYIRELTSGNVGVRRLLRIAVRAVGGLIGRRLRLVSYHPVPLQQEPVRTMGHLNLQRGDEVEVRSANDIAATVGPNGKTRGLSFDWEMLPHCGGRYRVRDRVERIIDERTGQMIEIESDCLILDGVVCSGEHSRGRWFCPRAIYPYWREAWLRRVEDADATPPKRVGDDVNSS